MKPKSNKGKQWTDAQLKAFSKLVDQNTPTRLIAYKLGRSVNSIYAKASKENISLKPVNRSPYGSKKKKK